MHKYIYLFPLVIAASLSSKAQIKQGSLLLGGNFTVGTATNNQPAGTPYSNKTTLFSIEPSLGKAIRDNLILGFSLTYNHQSTTTVQPTPPDDLSTFNQYGIGVFMREYRPLGGNFSLFLQEQMGGTYAKSTNTNSGNAKSMTIGLGFYPGVAYAVSQKVQLETGFQNLFFANYAYTKIGDDPSTTVKNSSFSAGTNLGYAFQNLMIGVRFLFHS